MTRTNKGRLIVLTSVLLLGVGFYFLFSGARELILPWWHQKEAAKTWPPPAPAPVPSLPVPSPPKSLDHSLFHTGDTVARLTIPRLNGEWYIVEGTEDKTLRLGPGHLTGTAF